MQMVVVAVGDEHNVHGRHLVKRNTGSRQAFGRAHPIRPDGIGDDGDAIELNDKGRMADPTELRPAIRLLKPFILRR